MSEMTKMAISYAILVASTVALVGCGTSKKSESAAAPAVDPKASPAKSNNEGAWAPLTAQVIDYDGNSDLSCTPGRSVYRIFLKTGFVIDERVATIDHSCTETVQHVGFVCTPSGPYYKLEGTADGQLMGAGNLGVYQNQKDCQGYANALRNKSPR